MKNLERAERTRRGGKCGGKIVLGSQTKWGRYEKKVE
jgi:hypothetical protein